jgi:hypothetical protein
MSRINIRKYKDEDVMVLTIELSPEQQKLLPVFIEHFDIEIEMLRAETKKLCNGETRYTIMIGDQEKAEAIKNHTLHIIAQSYPANPN